MMRRRGLADLQAMICVEEHRPGAQRVTSDMGKPIEEQSTPAARTRISAPRPPAGRAGTCRR